MTFALPLKMMRGGGVKVVKVCKDGFGIFRLEHQPLASQSPEHCKAGVVSGISIQEIRNQINRPNHYDDKKRREKKIIVGDKTTRNIKR